MVENLNNNVFMMAVIIIFVALVYSGWSILRKNQNDYEWVDDDGNVITPRHKNIYISVSLSTGGAVKKSLGPIKYAQIIEILDSVNNSERCYINRYGSFQDYISWVQSKLDEKDIPLLMENDFRFEMEYDGTRHKALLE